MAGRVYSKPGSQLTLAACIDHSQAVSVLQTMQQGKATADMCEHAASSGIRC